MKTVSFFIASALVAGAVAVAGCSDDDETGSTVTLTSGSGGAGGGGTGGAGGGGTGGDSACGVTPPESWSAPDWDDNAAVALALRDQLDALAVDTMRGAEEGTVVVDNVDVLTTLMEDGDPSLDDVTVAAFKPVLDDVFADFVALVEHGPEDLVDAEGNFTPGASGGIFGSSNRGINTGGIEVRQIADKGLFAGAGLYAYAVSLTSSDIDEATIDAIAALWGANAQMSTEGLTDSAGYSFRMGYFEPMSQSLIAAKAYAADAECVAERDAAIVSFFRTWEKAMMARFAYYANAAATTSANAEGDDDYASAMHGLAEGLGLALGFRGLEDPAEGPLSDGARVVSDEQIEAMMSKMGLDIEDLGDSSTGDLVLDSSAFETAVSELEEIIGEALDASDEEVEGWRSPTEG